MEQVGRSPELSSQDVFFFSIDRWRRFGVQGKGWFVPDPPEVDQVRAGTGVGESTGL